MERKLGHLFPMRGDLSFGIECTEVGEQCSRLGHSPRRRGSEPGQLGWIGCAPEGQFEQQRRQISIEHLRWATGSQRLVLRSRSRVENRRPVRDDRLDHGVARQNPG